MGVDDGRVGAASVDEREGVKLHEYVPHERRADGDRVYVAGVGEDADGREDGVVDHPTTAL